MLIACCHCGVRACGACTPHWNWWHLNWWNKKGHWTIITMFVVNATTVFFLFLVSFKAIRFRKERKKWKKGSIDGSLFCATSFNDDIDQLRHTENFLSTSSKSNSISLHSRDVFRSTWLVKSYGHSRLFPPFRFAYVLPYEWVHDRLMTRWILCRFVSVFCYFTIHIHTAS